MDNSANKDDGSILMKCGSCGKTFYGRNNGSDKCPVCGSTDVSASGETKQAGSIESSNIDQKSAVEKFKKSKLSKILLVMFVICLLTSIFCFRNMHILSGLIAVLQTGIFGVAWCMGMNFIKEKKPYLHTLAAIVGFVLIIPFVMLFSKTILPKYDWPESGLATKLPEPASNKGEIHTNTGDSFWVEVMKTKPEDYEKYKQQCIETGYEVDGDNGSSWGNSYEAYDKDGYHLILDYRDDSEEMSVRLEAPMELGELSWPINKLADLLPKPKSEKGKIERNSEETLIVYIGNSPEDEFNKYADDCSNKGFNAGYDRGDSYYRAENPDGYKLELEYRGNNIMYIRLSAPEKQEEEAEITEEKTDNETEAAAETDEKQREAEEPSEKADEETSEAQSEVTEKSDVAGDLIRDDIKEAIDSYETFVDEYCEFMKKYDSSDPSMLVEYTKLVAKEVDMSKKFEEIKDKDLTDAEALYYAEVELRCSDKLLKTASQLN